MRALLNEKQGITKVRGTWYPPSEEVPCFSMPWFHPSYLLRNPTKAEGGPKWMTWIDAQEVKRKHDELLALSSVAAD